MKGKKHLSFSSLIKFCKTSFSNIADKRSNNITHSISDCMLSGLACMYFQSSSLLSFQREMEEFQSRNNLRSLFGISEIPSDNGIRNVVDAVSPQSSMRDIFKEFYQRLQRGKHLEQYQIFPHRYLLNVDGTQYFRSTKISCPKCLKRGRKNHEYHCHQVLQGAIVKSGLKQVIPVMPEEICAQDGDKKEDCEINAFKRFIKSFAKDHNKLKVIINADALYPSTPVIEAIKSYDYNYIFGVKVDSHEYLFENVQSADLNRTYSTSKRGNKVVIEWYNGLKLFKGYELNVNYITAWEIVEQQDGTKKTQYYGRWITDLSIHDNNASIIVASARARWKIENECFNTLKNHGYEIEHNYGHGDENLCYNFYLFTLLAFLFHQIQQLTDKLFQAARAKYVRLDTLWSKMRAFIEIIYFETFEQLLVFMASTNKTLPP